MAAARGRNGLAAPRRAEVAPAGERPARAAQALHRVAVVERRRGGGARAAAPSAGRSSSRLEPAVERPPVERLAPAASVEHLEARVDPRLHRSLVQEVVAEAVDGADARLLQAGHRRVEPLAARAAPGRGLARLLELRAQAELQLARRLLGEGHGDHASTVPRPSASTATSRADQLARLAGARRRLHDQRLVERGADPLARRRGRRASVTASSAASGDPRARPGPSARRARSSFGPHTGRKSQMPQARVARRGRQEAARDGAIDRLEHLERRAARAASVIGDDALRELAGAGAVGEARLGHRLGQDAARRPGRRARAGGSRRLPTTRPAAVRLTPVL